MDQIDLSSLSSAVPAKYEASSSGAAPLAVNNSMFPRGPCDGSPGEASATFGSATADDEAEKDAMQSERRALRAMRRGRRIRAAMGVSCSKYVIDLGEYKKQKVKVYVQYEGFASGSLGDKKRELRVAITLPDNWVDAPVYKLKAAFLKTYNGRHPKRPLDVGNCLLSVSDGSYLSFSKEVFSDDALIGDSFHENEEIFLVTESDVEEHDAEILRLRDALKEYEKEAHTHATIDALTVVDMTTVAREIDPYKAHVLLIGMGQMYMLPVEPTYTVADIKHFIHFKGGPDCFPLGCLDVALVEHFEINVLGDDETMEQLAKRFYGPECSLIDEAEEAEEEGVVIVTSSRRRKAVLPLYWGKRLSDPKYFIWIPSLHTQNSFKGPEDQQEQVDPSQLAMGALPEAATGGAATAGGECAIS